MAPHIRSQSTVDTVVGNMLIYRDEAHITTPYARWLAPMVAPLFVAKDNTP